MSFNHTSGTQLIDMSLGLLSATESTIINHKDYYYNRQFPNPYVIDDQ